MKRFGDVTLGRVRSSADLKRVLLDLDLEPGVLIVKPSWYSPHPANFTSAEALRMLIEALDRRVVVTEGYSLDRQDGSMKFQVDGEAVDWRWVMKHPSWEWVREGGRWDEFRKQDRWFLDEHGFTDLFEEFGVDYVNVTEEVWSGRVVDPTTVKRAVEEKFKTVIDEKLYSFLPKRFHGLAGSPLISLGRVKGIGGTYPSLTLKNLFGLIPDPLRSSWHGPKDSLLGRSIVDIAKVYASFFGVHGVCEAIESATAEHPEGEVQVPWGRYKVVKGVGAVAVGRNLVSLDAVLCGLMGVDPEKVSYLQEGERAFGRYDRGHVEEARAAASEWFTV